MRTHDSILLAESSPWQTDQLEPSYRTSAMLRRALPKLERLREFIRHSAGESSVLLQLESCRLLSGRHQSAAQQRSSWLGPLSFHRSFAARPGTVLVQFPLAQTGEGAPACDVSTSRGCAAHKGPTWHLDKVGHIVVPSPSVVLTGRSSRPSDVNSNPQSHCQTQRLRHSVPCCKLFGSAQDHYRIEMKRFRTLAMPAMLQAVHSF